MPNAIEEADRKATDEREQRFTGWVLVNNEDPNIGQWVPAKWLELYHEFLLQDVEGYGKKPEDGDSKCPDCHLCPTREGEISKAVTTLLDVVENRIKQGEVSPQTAAELRSLFSGQNKECRKHETAARVCASTATVVAKENAKLRRDLQWLLDNPTEPPHDNPDAEIFIVDWKNRRSAIKQAVEDGVIKERGK